MNENVLASIISAAQFSVAAVIACIGIMVIAATAIALNQLFHRYWIPVNVFKWINENMKQDEPSKKKVPPTLDHGKN